MSIVDIDLTDFS